ncbi:MAG TPA: hypothetical protein PLY87_20875 [Planctomycetaceae bacterium]|nr:hypothetical protein [Planctomycetaceae bacterium]
MPRPPRVDEAGRTIPLRLVDRINRPRLVHRDEQSSQTGLVRRCVMLRRQRKPHLRLA